MPAVRPNRLLPKRLVLPAYPAAVVLALLAMSIAAWLHGVENVETCCAFWHMVDLIWIILYPLVYLIR